MVIFSAIKLKELFKKGRDYPWQKPQGCPCCRSYTIWGHGFAEAIFDGYPQPLLLKLYRCADCGCVIRLRPKGYFKRFQAPIETIRSSVACKQSMNRWLTIYAIFSFIISSFTCQSFSSGCSCFIDAMQRRFLARIRRFLSLSRVAAELKRV